MKFLLDTCVLSELIKKSPDEKVIKWILEQTENDLCISVLTIGEIQKGIGKLPDSDRKNNLHAWLHGNLKERFNNRIIEINTDIALTWGYIQGKAEIQGKKMSVIDSLIAVTAIVYKLTVVTRNVTDIESSGCKILNPWE